MLSLRPTIGFATPADAAAIAQLSRREIEYGLGWKYTPVRVRALLRDPQRNVITARVGTALAGFGVMTYGERTANLDLLAVRARFRRRGIGREIVRWLEEVARTAGIALVYVQVRGTNRGAIRFYQALDFQQVDEVAGYYHGRESATILALGIGALVEGS